MSVTETRTSGATRPVAARPPAQPADPTDSSESSVSSGPGADDGRATRAELGAFLRSRRERLGPEDVGLIPGLRRRTPGLRREEVAQVAGVGVTWYTWLEQGQAINASVQVLDAVAHALRLDGDERAHLSRLAGVPAVARPDDGSPLEPEVQTVLDGLHPIPAGIYNARYDLLAWNQALEAMFPPDGPGAADRAQRPLADLHRTQLLLPLRQPRRRDPSDVATMRGAFGRPSANGPGSTSSTAWARPAPSSPACVGRP